MKVIMVMLVSVDGKTTFGDNQNVYSWSSIEDKKQFFSLIKKNNLIVMGRITYDASQPVIKIKKGKLRIVLTRSPKKYLNQTIKGQLEFTDESPENLLKRLSLLGYKKMLLVGGGTINGLFLIQKIIPTRKILEMILITCNGPKVKSVSNNPITAIIFQIIFDKTSVFNRSKILADIKRIITVRIPVDR